MPYANLYMMVYKYDLQNRRNSQTSVCNLEMYKGLALV